MREQKFQVHYVWENNGYEPEVEFTLGKNEKGFTMHIVTRESNPRCEEKRHLHPVHFDSCVEWFVNFLPEKCDRYFNFEVNAAGAMNVAFHKDREDEIALTVEDVESFGIQTQIHDSYWEASYTIPFAFIEKYIPGYRFEEGMTICSNFYKCGEKTEYVHFAMWQGPFTETPDFHTPQFFPEIVLD